jgi:small GTP-binding protein
MALKDHGLKTMFKIVVVGSTSVGKTSIVERLITGSFADDIQSTVGVEFRSFVCQLDDHAVRLQVWDTAGQERFRSVSTAYFRDAVGAVLVYDITKEETFEDLGHWLTDLQQLCHPNAFVLLVGNKCDLEEQRRVGAQQVREFADQFRLECIETSAKSGQNIEETFTRMAYAVAARVDAGDIEVLAPHAGGRFALAVEQPRAGGARGCC